MVKDTVWVDVADMDDRTGDAARDTIGVNDRPRTTAGVLETVTGSVARTAAFAP
jgi:hypothetical protein